MYLSIDIGGSYIKYALIQPDFSILRKWKKPTKLCSDSKAFYDYLCEGIDVTNMEAIGVSAPGIIADDSTVLSRAAQTICVMQHTKVNQEIKKRLSLPVFTINDARAAALCEVTLGAAKDYHSSAYWIIGTGIGGALFHEGQLVKGTDNLAGEFSHLPVGIVNGRLRGISSLTSIPALLQLYRQHSAENIQEITSEEICSRYQKQESAAVAAMEEWCLNTVMALDLVTIFFNPEIICIGGGISEVDWFIAKIQDLYSHQIKHTFSDLVTTKVERCCFGNDANLIGAVIHAAEQLNLDK